MQLKETHRVNPLRLSRFMEVHSLWYGHLIWPTGYFSKEHQPTSQCSWQRVWFLKRGNSLSWYKYLHVSFQTSQASKHQYKFFSLIVTCCCFQMCLQDVAWSLSNILTVSVQSNVLAVICDWNLWHQTVPPWKPFAGPSEFFFKQHCHIRHLAVSESAVVSDMVHLLSS